MATQDERRRLTYQKLVDSARKLFAKTGYNSTSIDQIVTECNVAKGTYYQHFKCKLDILIAIERIDHADMTLKTLDAIKNGAQVLPQLKGYLQSLCAWFEKRKNIAEAVILSRISSKGSLLDQDDYHLSGRYFIKTLIEAGQKQKQIRSDIPSVALTMAIGGMIAISVLSWSKNPEKGTLWPMMETGLTLFLQGAQCRRNTQGKRA